jgi:hypothetical protein
MGHTLCDSLLLKIEEQIERSAHLADLLPDETRQLPLSAFDDWTACDLLGHLIACTAGFCAALYAADKERLAHFQRLRELPKIPSMDSRQFRARAEIFGAHIREAFALLDDAALGQIIPTVFVPSGQTLMTLLLGNLEHLINHKRQLFEFLKRQKIAVGTGDLYKLPGLAIGK